MRATKFWIEFHKISGLIILIPLLLQCISGSIIVFDHAIDEWLNPDMLITTAEPGSTLAPMSDVMSAAQTALPQTAHIRSLRKPRHEETVYTAFVEMQPHSPLHGKRMEILIDPYTAKVTGTREWGTYFTSFIYLLHFTLLMGTNGALFLGLLAIVVLINIIIGVYLGWPKSRKGWNWLLARQDRKTPLIGLLRRWHILIGLLSLPVLVVLTVSGISMIFHDQTESLLNRPQAPKLEISNTDNSPIDIDQWLPSAEQFWPEAEWMRISPPTANSPTAALTLRKADDPRHTTGSYMLWLNPSNSEVLAEQDYSQLSLRQKTAFWLFPLHSGEAFGMTGRILVFICGLLAAGLTIAGGWLWYRRQFRRRERFT